MLGMAAVPPLGRAASRPGAFSKHATRIPARRIRPVFSCPLQSQMALACDRKTDQGLKESAKFFQVRCAAAGAGRGPARVSCLVSSRLHLLIR